MFKKAISFAIMFLFATGCALSTTAVPPVTLPQPLTLNPQSPDSPTPTSLSANVWEAQIIKATADANLLEMQRASIVATEQAQATREARAYSATATAQFYEEQATSAFTTRQALANEIQTTRQAEMITFNATATAETYLVTRNALQRQEQREIVDERNREAMRTWLTGGGLFIGFLLLLVVITVLWRWAIMQIDTAAMRMSTMETRAGTVVYLVDGNGRLTPQLLSANPRSPITEPQPPITDARVIESNGIPFYANGRLQHNIIPGDDPRAQEVNEAKSMILSLLHQSIQQNGRDSTQIASWRNLRGFGSDKWQRAIAILKANNAADTKPGSGTYINEERFPDLQAVVDAIDNGRLEFAATEN